MTLDTVPGENARTGVVNTSLGAAVTVTVWLAAVKPDELTEMAGVPAAVSRKRKLPELEPFAMTIDVSVALSAVLRNAPVAEVSLNVTVTPFVVVGVPSASWRCTVIVPVAFAVVVDCA